LRVASAVLLSAALLAACTGDDDDDSSRVVAPRISQGCGASTVAPGEQVVQDADIGRAYIRHVPPMYSKDTPMPLVIDFHGYSEPAEIHTKLTGLGAFGDTHGFVTATPIGLGTPVRWDVNLQGDDVEFVRRMIGLLEADLCIDRARLFATGLSNGAFMTSVVACSLADKIAAVAPVAGVRDPAGCEPSRPVPLLAIHGTDDEYVRYDGGLGVKGLDLPAPDGSGRKVGELAGRDAIGTASVPDIVKAWAKRDGCSTSAQTTNIADDVKRVAYDCPDDVDVQLYTVTGGGHTWPGTPLGSALEPFVGRTTTSISTNEVIWRFFRRHPMRVAEND
jgi:polyhydroxybutyrate depolymerase